MKIQHPDGINCYDGTEAAKVIGNYNCFERKIALMYYLQMATIDYSTNPVNFK
jgi:hypothetical protein